ncbi:competence protein ComK [Sporosarcina obsidiansis]|uniref:competence protein ComK n=1 Tax=Sporosarcina obsidiansis TaxID=2660748 RepID=UPI00129BDA6A|nr:competence protein ComK [Sporosarcina obsidiansis]
MANQQYLSSYIITFHTFALLHGQHSNPYFTKVVESNQTFFVEKTPLEIMRDSCTHYRTNFESIMNSSKSDLRKRHKPPIMLTHSNNRPLLFFPLLSPSLHKNSWIAYHAVKDVHKNEDGVCVVLKNDTKMPLNTSIATVYRQLALSHILSQRFENAQEELRSSYYLIMEPKNSDSPIS